MARRVRHYELYETVGRGGQGIVKRAIDTRTGNTVAVKIMHNHPGASDAVAEEFAILERLRGCENIVEFYEYFLHDDGKFYIVSEWVGGGELFNLIQPNIGLPNRDYCRHLFRNIIQGMVFCHSRGVTHRDLKPENLMLTEDGRTAKIIDFGFARIFQTDGMDQALYTRRGTPYYVAPEVFSASRTNPYTYAADIWSLGVILFAMVSGQFPMEQATPNVREFQAIRSGNYAYPPWNDIEPRLPAAYEVLRGMLTVNVEQRWTLPQIWHSAFVQGDGWVPHPFSPIVDDTAEEVEGVGVGLGGREDPYRTLEDVLQESTSSALDAGWTLTSSISQAGAPNSVQLNALGGYDDFVYRSIPSTADVNLLPVTAYVDDIFDTYRSAPSHIPPSTHANVTQDADALLHSISEWVASVGGQADIKVTKSKVNVVLPSKYGEIQMKCLVESSSADPAGCAVKCIRRCGPILEFNRLRDQLVHACVQ